MAVASTYPLFLLPAWCAYAVLFLLLVATAAHDARTRIVPNGFVLAGCSVWFAALGAIAVLPAEAGFASPASAFEHIFGHPLPLVLATRQDARGAMVIGLTGALSIGAVMIACAAIMGRAREGPAVGGGDVKLAMLLGLYLGCVPAACALVAACVLALLWEGSRFALALVKRAIVTRRRVRPTPKTVVLGPVLGPVLGSALRSSSDSSLGSPSERLPDGTFPFAPFMAVSAIAVGITGFL